MHATPIPVKDSDDQCQLKTIMKRRNRRRKKRTAIVAVHGDPIPSSTLPEVGNDKRQSIDGSDTQDKTRNGRKKKKMAAQIDCPPKAGNDQSQLTNETRNEKQIQWLIQNRMRQNDREGNSSI